MSASQNLTVNWKNVPTRTITAGRVEFAYRELGTNNSGTPVVFLVHLAAVLDNWDPRIVDGFPAKRRVITFDNRGIGASSDSPATSKEQMAKDAITFIKAMGFEQVDLFGFSMAGWWVLMCVATRGRSRFQACSFNPSMVDPPSGARRGRATAYRVRIATPGQPALENCSVPSRSKPWDLLRVEQGALGSAGQRCFEESAAAKPRVRTGEAGVTKVTDASAISVVRGRLQ
jgi:pimeloyl-ACP methyl ester carboxylesterase